MEPTTLHVPIRCRRVFDLLAQVYPRQLSNRDITLRTGHPCDERKLRELAAANPLKDYQGNIMYDESGYVLSWAIDKTEHRQGRSRWLTYGLSREAVEGPDQGRLAL